ncbi:thioredoxin domain-containing protein 11-like [Gigantopelta aegis]|uniref:thioredoxin domain-containing protein 11-like n=1 Tax=Gigantopelta aegis TaxID=1735272 RepID=UPI001B88A7C4|nr:thioredoxin domain-containing protein 11-like [Gigantopelta aegis]
MESAVANPTSHVAHPSVWYRAMTRHPELFLLAITLSVTVISRYGNSLKSKPITIPPRPPKRFFPLGSPVLEFPYGELDPVVELLGQEEVIFLMYYAPWCAKSMAVRWEFNKAAKHLQNQVKFVAVNCWWPDGQCRKRYKFLMYPVLFVYYLNIDGYRYLGVLSADHMVKFLENIMYPLTSFHRKTEILDFIARHDSAVLGYFDFNASPQPPGFQQFYLASMRVVEHDPHQPVKFGVTFQKQLAEVFNLTESRDVIMLRVANTTVKYSRDSNFTSTQLVSWSLINRQKPIVKWLSPLGVKSLAMSTEISRGPAVIGFYSHNSLFDTNQPFHVMKDIALQFRNCSDSANISDIIMRWRQQALRAAVSYQEVVKFCDKYRKQQHTDLSKMNCCVTVVTSLEQSSHKNICEYCVHRQSPTLNSLNGCSLNFDNRQLPKWTTLQTNICQNSIENYNTFEYHSLCCRDCTELYQNAVVYSFSPKSFSSDKRKLTDRYLWQSLENYPKRLCSKLTLQKVEGVRAYRDLVHFDHEAILSNISGLGCRTNKTISFYAMDAVHHSVFAERLGVNISSLPSQPAVVIVDKENEEEYLLKENFTAASVASFVINFTTGNIRRHLRSMPVLISNCDNNQNEVCITEVNSETFQQIVMAAKKDVMVLMYSHWCGFCASMAHNYLTLSRYFQTASSILFTRFNADENDLPWELTVESYPVLIFFPADRKADSIVFPRSVEMSLPNLIRFVLQHSNHKLRLQAALAVCSVTCIRRNRDYARSSRRDLEQRRLRLQGTLMHLLSTVDTGTAARRKYTELSIRSVSRRLMEMSKEISVVVRLLKLLESEIDPLPLQDFLEEGGGEHLESDSPAS